jgi:hypothetical protein
MNPSIARRFQVSIRTLLLATAVLAMTLTPLAWVARERHQMQQIQREMLRAREEAIRSVLLAERLRSGPPETAADATAARTPEAPPVSPEVLIEHLRRENNELKDTVDDLREEVRRLRASKTR